MSQARPGPLAGARPSPNIWHHTETYELENRAFDPDGLVWTTMRGVRDWQGAAVLDLGCGTGFHLPYFSRTAAHVVGVEPHPELVALARRRTRRLEHVEVHQGLAQRLPLPTDSVDVVHARWAYFFGPGCEPGLAELERVVRPGGVAFVIDNDPTRGTFGPWFREGFPDHHSPATVADFWAAQGFDRSPVMTRWAFDSFDDLASVVRIELPGHVAHRVIAEHRRSSPVPEVAYAVDVWWRRY
ncbi:class I SAM-dependent methyltransferase [Nocardioides sp. CBS4Y-1]|uniref:Class I SAM-dependent methyltransferase n=1 Tax=Nocardioides acrostichi TaxID=2784339 RepID=A0A930UZN0_9ACTN|nr:class I SAM-dependent methyltransferase [Nocardioides acrostichi]